VRRLLTPRWLARHAAAIALIAAFLWLGRWQYGRAIGGNNLSWAYTFQWPVFAVFVLVVWIRMMRGDARSTKDHPPPLRPMAPVGPVQQPPDDDDPELSAYNRYLAWLAAHPDRRPSEYPG
jgi:hypothetical protein